MLSYLMKEETLKLRTNQYPMTFGGAAFTLRQYRVRPMSCPCYAYVRYIRHQKFERAETQTRLVHSILRRHTHWLSLIFRPARFTLQYVYT